MPRHVLFLSFLPASPHPTRCINSQSHAPTHAALNVGMNVERFQRCLTVGRATGVAASHSQQPEFIAPTLDYRYLRFLACLNPDFHTPAREMFRHFATQASSSRDNSQGTVIQLSSDFSCASTRNQARDFCHLLSSSTCFTNFFRMLRITDVWVLLEVVKFLQGMNLSITVSCRNLELEFRISHAFGSLDGPHSETVDFGINFSAGGILRDQVCTNHLFTLIPERLRTRKRTYLVPLFNPWYPRTCVLTAEPSVVPDVVLNTPPVPHGVSGLLGVRYCTWRSARRAPTMRYKQRYHRLHVLRDMRRCRFGCAEVETVEHALFFCRRSEELDDCRHKFIETMQTIEPRVSSSFIFQRETVCQIAKFAYKMFAIFEKELIVWPDGICPRSTASEEVSSSRAVG
ncbi:hypothetical protein C8R45DRAFT_931426 [Mycena sanguinolenta]|nr:hypothetical protein C8R45DRAFT_931426 [Mycena sanguinolenta]